MMYTIFVTVIQILASYAIIHNLGLLVRLLVFNRYDDTVFNAAYYRMYEWQQEGKLPKGRSLYDQLMSLCGSWSKTTTNHRLRSIAGPNGWFYYQVLVARKRRWTWNTKYL